MGATGQSPPPERVESTAPKPEAPPQLQAAPFSAQDFQLLRSVDAAKTGPEGAINQVFSDHFNFNSPFPSTGDQPGTPPRSNDSPGGTPSPGDTASSLSYGDPYTNQNGIFSQMSSKLSEHPATPEVPPESGRPFSAAEIAGSGIQAAALLAQSEGLPPGTPVELPSGSHAGSEMTAPGGSSSLAVIERYDNPDQINTDIAAFSNAGAAAGVQQSGLSDCWFQSSVAGLANSPGGAEKISQMISSNPDGGYTVTFPGDKDNPVTVTQAEVDANPKINDSAQWDRVLEAANLKRDNYQDVGGDASKAIQLLTGDSTAQPYSTSDNGPAAIAGLIQSSLDAGQPVVASTNKDIKAADGSVVQRGTTPPLESGHDYTVTGFDPATNTVTLRNPWAENTTQAGGNATGSTENGITVGGAGELSMSMDTFMNNYSNVFAGTGESSNGQVAQTEIPAEQQNQGDSIVPSTGVGGMTVAGLANAYQMGKLVYQGMRPFGPKQPDGSN